MDNKPATNDASSALAGAIDDFLGGLERKFKTVNDEILTKRESTCPLTLAEYSLRQQIIGEDIAAVWKLMSLQWMTWPSVAIALRRSC
jgi:hypothetical protein